MQQKNGKHVGLQGVDAHTVLRTRRNLALDIDRRCAHGDLEGVADTGAEQRLERCVDSAINAVTGSLAVALGEHVDQLLNLAQLAQDYLSAKGLFILDLKLEVTQENRGVRERLHTSIDRRNDVLGYTSDSLVPR